MSSDKRILEYTQDLADALRMLPPDDHQEIVREIRSHLEHRLDEGRLEQALSALGRPAECARRFLDEYRLKAAHVDGGPGKTFGALAAIATRRLAAATGFFLAGIFFLLAAGFGVAVVMEIVLPEQTGLWINADHGSFAFGFVSERIATTSTEILGAWMILASAVLACLCYFCGHLLAHLFVRIAIRESSN